MPEENRKTIKRKGRKFFGVVKNIDTGLPRSAGNAGYLLIATDFISGMTDGYAKTLYRKMSGLE